MDGADPDKTVRFIKRARARTPSPRWPWPWIAAVVLLAVGMGALGVLLWRPAPPVFEVAGEARILDHQARELTVFRFAGNPAVLVLDFPTLREQADMLNRVAAFVEKAGAPRDRVLTEAELATLISRLRTTPETFYYGHDYAAADLARFFAAADLDHITLNEREQDLRRLADGQHWLLPGAIGALISIPRAGSNPFVDRHVRAVILRHELSHGEYFSNPAYAAASRRLWTETFTPADRDGVRRFLADQDYDSSLEDLMINEGQAYLMHTRDDRFVSAAELGLSQQHMEALRAAFWDAMPAGWLKDATPAPVLAPRCRRRFWRRDAGDTRSRRQWRRAVGTVTAATATRSPLARAAATARRRAAR